MRNKMVRDRRKSSLFVESSVETHGAIVAAALAAFFADKLQEGEAMPDFLMVMRLYQRALAEVREELIVASAEHLRELDNDIAARRERDGLVGRLGVNVRRVRDLLNALFGAGRGVELAGIEGRTAQEPVDLLAQTELIIERLDQPSDEPGPGFAKLQPDPQDILAELMPDYEALQAVVNRLNRERRQADATKVGKDVAVERNDRYFGWIISGLLSFYNLAGQLELAKRIRPSSRRPGRTQAQAAAKKAATEAAEPAVEEPEAKESADSGEKSASDGSEAAS